ncbi:hypothetical protein FACS189413_06820 [Bacteroidia bacterium]|nr:hypothetical protein FACS189413_06820 [Bacteroidia bacterium]
MKGFLKTGIVLTFILLFFGCEEWYNTLLEKEEPPEEEIISAAEIEQAYQEIKLTAESALAGDNPTESLEALAQSIGDKEGVESVNYDENSLTVRFADGTGHFWIYTPYAEADSTAETNEKVAPPQAAQYLPEAGNSASLRAVANANAKKKILIVNTQWRENRSENTTAINRITNLFAASSEWAIYQVPQTNGSGQFVEPDINFFKTGLSGYDVIFLIAYGHKEVVSQGLSVKDFFWLQTSQTKTYTAVDNKIEIITQGTNGNNTSTHEYYYVSQKFIEENYSSGFPNTLIYTTAECMGMMSWGSPYHLTAKAFKAKAFVGWDKYNPAAVTKGADLFEALGDQSLKSALSQIGFSEDNSNTINDKESYAAYFSSNRSDNIIRVYTKDAATIPFWGIPSKIESPDVSTITPTEQGTTVVLRGKINSNGGASITEKGFWIGTSINPRNTGVFVENTTSGNEFSNTLSNVNPGTYYVQAYAKNSAGKEKTGTQMSYTVQNTVPANDAKIKLTPENGIDIVGSIEVNTSYEVRFVILNTGTTPLRLTSFQLSNTTDFSASGYTLNQDIAPQGYQFVYAVFTPKSAGNKTCNITVKSNAVNAQSIVYTLTGTGVITPPADDAKIGITPPNGFDFGEVTVNGSTSEQIYIVNAGTTPLRLTSVTWDNKTDFAVSGYSTTQDIRGINDGQDVIITFSPKSAGSKTCNIKIKSNAVNVPEKTYTVTGTGKAAAVSTAPTVTISSNVGGISTNEATVAGSVTSDGGANITGRGICYSSTTTNPTTSSSKVTASGTTGAYTCTLTGLSANTTYYARAYATNSKGTSYSSYISFTTTAVVSNPTFSPAQGTYTACSGSNKTCNGHSFLAGTIKATVIGYSTSSNMLNLRIKKCSGSFTNSGTAYVNTGSAFSCTNAIASMSYGAGVSDININVPLQSGTTTYWVTVASATTDYFYANAITVTY